MNLEFISRAYHATKLALEAKAPTLMVVGGVVSMGAAVVTAGKQTLKVEAVLAKHTPDLEKVEQGTKLNLKNYTKEDARGDRIVIYTKAGIDLAKLYAVPAILFAAGAGLVFRGHHMMVQRNATLALAFTSLKKAYDSYRANTRKAMGPEFDQAMLTGYKNREIIHEDGTVSTISERDWDEEGYDPYNRVFEQGESDQWVPDLGINKFFIQRQVKFAQERLNRQGYLYLSDLYQALGFQETPLSRTVGWKSIRLPDGSKSIPVIDVGLDKPLKDDWKYSRDSAIYLDINCQGLIIGGKIQKALESA